MITVIALLLLYKFRKVYNKGICRKEGRQEALLATDADRCKSRALKGQLVNPLEPLLAPGLMPTVLVVGVFSACKTGRETTERVTKLVCWICYR